MELPRFPFPTRALLLLAVLALVLAPGALASDKIDYS